MHGMKSVKKFNIIRSLWVWKNRNWKCRTLLHVSVFHSVDLFTDVSIVGSA